MTIGYRTTLAEDAKLRQRIRAIAQEHRRLGCRLHVLLKREGYLINHKKAVPALSGREADDAPPWWPQARAIGTSAPMLVSMTPNHRWSLDFVADQLTDGRRYGILTAVDDCTRECLALVAGHLARRPPRGPDRTD